jgi:lysozyme
LETLPWNPGVQKVTFGRPQFFMSNHKVSDAGIEFITHHEGVVLTPYLDSAGLPTVGVGHLLTAGDPFDRPITHDEANQLLRSDLAKAETALNNCVNVTLNQNQVNACLSLIFNIGGSAFRNSTLLRMINQGRFKDAAEQFLVWNKITVKGQKVPSKGLTTRRQAERALFLTAAYPPEP